MGICVWVNGLWGMEAGESESNHESLKEFFFFFQTSRVGREPWPGSSSVKRRDLDSALDHEPNATGLCYAVVVKTCCLKDMRDKVISGSSVSPASMVCFRDA